jgi:hypoxanthine phosphoribosyltransferase
MTVRDLLDAVPLVERAYEWYRRRRVQTWPAVADAMLGICRQLRSEHWYPQTVLGVGLGGTIVGALVRAQFQDASLVLLPPTYTYNEHTGRQTDFEPTAELTNALEKSSRVLLVCGQARNGTTLQKAREFIRARFNAELKTAAMYVAERTTIAKPDYPGYLLPHAVEPPWRLEPK